MSEAVRLLIWDLDEVFWRGTLTEGGICYQPWVQDIVISLARRGIVSSICSKNDHDRVKAILQGYGIWDHFVFPNIDWTSKGPRLLSIINLAQLRPPTVMFIDDNPMNRNEASHYCPGIQVEDETFLPRLLDDRRFLGKDDFDCIRLSQYKLLERRASDQSASSGSRDFLRKSGVRASITFDIDKHLDRAIELINRTNQLNFTKKRLSDDILSARAELRKELRDRNVQAGLLHVSDNYGDYGFVGFYLLHVHTWRLVHFCFSCRTLGMEVERWLYDRLRKPSLTVAGEVVTDILTSQDAIDWINNENDSEAQLDARLIGRVFVRGGCEMQAIAHYIGILSTDIVTEFQFDRGGFPIVIGHSAMLRNAIEGVTEQQTAAARMVGLNLEDFRSSFSLLSEASDVYIFSFWADAMYSIYEDIQSGLRIPFGIYGINNGGNIAQHNLEDLRPRLEGPGMVDKVEALRGNFRCLHWSPGLLEESGKSLLYENLVRIFDSVDTRSPIFVLLGCEKTFDADGNDQPVGHMIELNRHIRQAADGRANVYLLAVEDFICEASDILDATHFERRVYFRISENIVSITKETVNRA